VILRGWSEWITEMKKGEEYHVQLEEKKKIVMVIVVAATTTTTTIMMMMMMEVAEMVEMVEMVEMKMRGVMGVSPLSHAAGLLCSLPIDLESRAMPASLLCLGIDEQRSACTSRKERRKE
jgi:hypothetical protein